MGGQAGQLGFAAGGAVIGSFIPGVGTAIGWTVGSIIGALAFPPKGEDTEGPRVTDLKVMGADYGTPIPYGVGTPPPIAGFLMWVRDGKITEVKNTETIGGKGGGGATNTTYSYFFTGAVGIIEGPVAALLQIRADDKIIYDQVDNTTNTHKPGLKFRFYPGDETQLPDSLIEADKGAGNVSANRGLCYVVFDELPLQDFGNHIPNFSFLVAFEATDPKLFEIASGTASLSTSNPLLYVDWERARLYQVASTTDGDAVLLVFDLNTFTEIRVQKWEDIVPTYNGSAQIYGVSKSGDIMAVTNAQGPGPDDKLHYLIDKDSLVAKWTFGTNSSTQHGPTDMGFVDEGAGCTSVEAWTEAGFRYFQVTKLLVQHVIQIMDELGNYVWDSENEPGIAIAGRPYCTWGQTGTGFGEFHVGDLSGGTVQLYRVKVNAFAHYDSLSGSTIGVEFDNYAAIDTAAKFGESFSGHAVAWDETDDSIILLGVGASADHVGKIARDGTVVWVRALPFRINGSGVNDFPGGWNSSRLQNGRIGFIEELAGGSATADVIALDTGNGSITYQATGYDSDIADGDPQIYDSVTHSVIAGGDNNFRPFRTFLDRSNGLAGTVGDAVRLLSSKVGLDIADINTTDVDALELPGWVIGRPGPARAALEPLMRVYLFDGVESDYIMKFPTRGKATVATIPQDDLGVVDTETGAFYKPTRVQEVELPERVGIVYSDADKDYVQQTHGSKRMLEPVNRRAIHSRNVVHIPIPAALKSGFVKQQAEKILYEAWIGRTSDPMRLPWKYLELDPTDSVVVELDSGVTFRTRLTGMTIGADLTLEINALRENSAQYSSTLVADSGSGSFDRVLPGPSITKLILLSSVLLRDTDDVGRTHSRMYYFLAGYGDDNWPSATLYKSTDNSLYYAAGASNDEAAWGVATNVLPSTDTPFLTDETNVLRVFMTTGGDRLSSVTKLQMLDGANAAALIRADGEAEIIQFQNVTPLGGNAYELDTILRGRRGSEKFVSGHSTSDTFVLLETGPGEIHEMPLGDVDLTRFYKGVGQGQLLEEVAAISKVSPGNDLKCYAPAHLKLTSGSWGFDIDLEWVRRTRVGGEMKDGTGTVPLSEDSEEYKLEILDSPGGSVIRTETGISSPAFTYTVAMQDADFGGAQTELTWQVRQISAQVGDGFVSDEKTVEV